VELEVEEKKVFLLMIGLCVLVEVVAVLAVIE
jgi:hypothetical protein